MADIKVKDETKPKEVTKKHRPWLGKMQIFDSVKAGTPKEEKKSE